MIGLMSGMDRSSNFSQTETTDQNLNTSLFFKACNLIKRTYEVNYRFFEIMFTNLQRWNVPQELVDYITKLKQSTLMDRTCRVC